MEQDAVENFIRLSKVRIINAIQEARQKFDEDAKKLFGNRLIKNKNITPIEGYSPDSLGRYDLIVDAKPSKSYFYYRGGKGISYNDVSNCLAKRSEYYQTLYGKESKENDINNLCLNYDSKGSIYSYTITGGKPVYVADEGDPAKKNNDAIFVTKEDAARVSENGMLYFRMDGSNVSLVEFKKDYFDMPVKSTLVYFKNGNACEIVHYRDPTKSFQIYVITEQGSKPEAYVVSSLLNSVTPPFYYCGQWFITLQYSDDFYSSVDSIFRTEPLLPQYAGDIYFYHLATSTLFKVPELNGVDSLANNSVCSSTDTTYILGKVLRWASAKTTFGGSVVDRFVFDFRYLFGLHITEESAVRMRAHLGYPTPSSSLVAPSSVRTPLPLLATPARPLVTVAPRPTSSSSSSALPPRSSLEAYPPQEYGYGYPSQEYGYPPQEYGYGYPSQEYGYPPNSYGYPPQEYGYQPPNPYGGYPSRGYPPNQRGRR